MLGAGISTSAWNDTLRLGPPVGGVRPAGLVRCAAPEADSCGVGVGGFLRRLQPALRLLRFPAATATSGRRPEPHHTAPPPAAPGRSSSPRGQSARRLSQYRATCSLRTARKGAIAGVQARGGMPFMRVTVVNIRRYSASCERRSTTDAVTLATAVAVAGAANRAPTGRALSEGCRSARGRGAVGGWLSGWLRRGGGATQACELCGSGLQENPSAAVGT